MDDNGACVFLLNFLLLFYFHLIADVNLKNLYIIRTINPYSPIFIENLYIFLDN